MNEQQLPSEEISRRITTGMGLVYDLFTEMHSLFRMIAQGLENSDADVQPQGPKGFILPRGKKGVTVADRFLRTDMGLLVAIGAAGSDEVEDDSDDVAEDDESEAEKDSATVAITPDTQYLGIRAILFDPQLNDPTKSQPVLVAGILSAMSKEPRAKKKAGGKKPETKFKIRRATIKLLVKQLPVDAESGQVLTALVRGAILNAQLGSVHIVPLAEITTEEKVNEFVDRLVAMVEG